jgi:hypothetical protein
MGEMFAIVVINGAEYKVYLDDEAREAVRLTFNPSGNQDVMMLKILAAAHISTCNSVQKAKPDAGRELAVAKTNMQTASMWSVLGATKGL